MIVFSGCKINLGLNVVRRRSDGFHDIESVFWPMRGLCDIVELQAARPGGEVEFSQSGLTLDCPDEKNLCVRAFRLMQQRFAIKDGARIHLHKRVPTGAGLGGGSANATSVLKMTDRLWSLGLNDARLTELSAQLGSDTAFFVLDRPALATSRGEVLMPVELCLAGYYILIVKPDVAVSTAEAYGMVAPGAWDVPVAEIVGMPVEKWRGLLKNDFETPVFARYPLLGDIKEWLYSAGALYASMSGSGSALYGVFRNVPSFETEYFTYLERVE